jgi:hypothetical protein
MPTLHIDLRDGFDHDDVVLKVNNREAARGSDVTTDLTISHAASFDVPAPEGRCALRIEIPTRNLSSSLDLDPADTPYVAIFVREGRVDFHKLKEAMPML